VCLLAYDELLGGGWKGQVRALKKLRGLALVFFFRSLEDAYHFQLLPWTALFHHCRSTVVADRFGFFRTYRRWNLLTHFPIAVFCLSLDLLVLGSSWCFLQLLKMGRTSGPLSIRDARDRSIAYLYPFPLNRSSAGGAMSHVRGVLAGLAENHVRYEIFSGRPLPCDVFPLQAVALGRQPSLLWEARMLVYNFRFSAQVRKQLKGKPVRALYQRHGRIAFAGALLSRWMHVPLVLEYNGSEVWMSKHWDPGRFGRLIALCEDVALRNASLIVVVAEASRQELVDRGIPDSTIFVNPNGVDPEFFRPGCARPEIRRQLGIADDRVLVTFVGSFGPWHGVEILGNAIKTLLAGGALEEKPCFLLIGEGSLLAKIQGALAQNVACGEVILTGTVARERVRDYLDASDIVVSPHVSMPDGKPFFGSPTKLFEYMAMTKAIVASNLDQLAQVLTHGESAWLVEPDSAAELAAAIRLLAANPGLRTRLGRNARAAVLARHTWRQNVGRLLRRLDGEGDLIASPASVAAVQ